MAEALVIVDEAHADSVLAQVGQLAQVMQRLPPRLAIVKGDDLRLEAVRRVPGVVAVCKGTVPDSVLQQLKPTEQVFAEAWGAGRQPKTARPGDGLPWDAKGFQPPDRKDDGSQR